MQGQSTPLNPAPITAIRQALSAMVEVVPLCGATSQGDGSGGQGASDDAAHGYSLPSLRSEISAREGPLIRRHWRKRRPGLPGSSVSLLTRSTFGEVN
jgi:hypothetical protein